MPPTTKWLPRYTASELQPGEVTTHTLSPSLRARGQITEIFNVLVNLPACNEGLLSRLWPTVSAVIGSPPNKFEPGTIEVRVISLLHGEGKRLVVQ